MSSLLNRLFLRQKFALLGTLAAILIAIPLSMYVNEARKVIDVAQTESDGLAPVRAVLDSVLLIQQHRGLSAMALSGNENAQAQRAAKQVEVDKSIAAADKIINSIGDASIAARWKEATERWSALPAKVAQRQLSGGESFAAHTSLVGQLMKVSDLIVDHYRLSLDAQPDSKYLIDAAIFYSPDLIETLGRLRARGALILTARTASIEDRAMLTALIEKAKERYASTRNSFEKSIAQNPSVKLRLESRLQATLAQGDEVLRLATEQIVKAEEFTYAGPDYFNKLTAAIGEQVQFYDAAMAMLNEMLAERQARLTRMLLLLTGSLLGIAVFACFFGILIIRSITGPLHKAVTIAMQVASGDLTADIEVQHYNEAGQLLQALKDMNNSLAKIVAEVRNGTEAIAAASSEIASGNIDLSSRTEEEASSLDETASTMEQITDTVRLNADNAREANQLALSASDVAAKGGEMVSHMVETMSSINASSRKIVDIIGVIDGIAFQTNILALNAAVEASRAGEQGRGFAVVASEVRNLAQRSAAAAKEIKELINKSVENVDAGTKLVDQTGATMEEIVAGIKHVADIVAEIAAASGEQRTSIEQINTAIEQMDRATQQNAALVEQEATASKALREQARKLFDVVSIFRLDQQHRATSPATPVAPSTNMASALAQRPSQDEARLGIQASRRIEIPGKKKSGKTGPTTQWFD